MILKIQISLFLLCVTWKLSRSQPVDIEDIFDVSQNEEKIISSLAKRFAEDKAETNPSRKIRRGNSHFSNHPPLEENQSIPVVIVYDEVKVVQPRRSKSTVTSTTLKTDSVTNISNKKYIDSTSTESTISKEDTTVEKVAFPQIDVTINTENISESNIKLKSSNKLSRDVENIKQSKTEISNVRTIPKEDTSKTGNITETSTENNIIKSQATTVPPHVRHFRQKQIPVVVVQDTNDNTNWIKVKTTFNAPKTSSNNTVPQTIDIENIEEPKKKLKISNEENIKNDKKNKITATHDDKITKQPDRDSNKNINIDNKNIKDTSLDNSTRKSKLIRQKDPIVPIVESTNVVFAHTGKFEYSYESGDGTKAFENGKLKEFDEDRTGEAVVGGFSYKDKDGNDFAISYTADENGYRPVGAHLPTPPPIPPIIARALAYLATKTTPKPATESIKEIEATTVSKIDEAKI